MKVMKGSPIEPLPLNVVLLNVCRHLTLADLGRASRVSWHWRDVFRRDGAVAHIRAHIIGVLPDWEQAVFEGSHRYTWYKLEHYVAPITHTLGCHFKEPRRSQVMQPLLVLVLSPEHHKRFAASIVFDKRPVDVSYEWGFIMVESPDKRIYITFSADAAHFVAYVNHMRHGAGAVNFLSGIVNRLLSMGEITPFRHAFDVQINAACQ